MNKMSRMLLVILLGAAPASHAAEAADQVDMAYDIAAIDAPITPFSKTCPVTVMSLTDLRPNKESIGTAVRPIMSGDPLPWMSGAFTNLKAWGFDAKAGDKPAAGGIGLSAGLTRSYVWNISMRLNGMVAMTVDYLLPSGERLTRKYRASGSKNNWANTVSEHMTTLNIAMNNTLGKIAADLEKLCQGGQAALSPSATVVPASTSALPAAPASTSAPPAVLPATTSAPETERDCRRGTWRANRRAGHGDRHCASSGAAAGG